MNTNENTEPAEKPQVIPSAVGMARRDYFALQFALRLIHVKQVAPGKVAVPRNKGEPTMKIDCQFGVAIQMADDLCTALDETAGPKLTVVEPPVTNEQTQEKKADDQPSDSGPSKESN
jgi:hypothetical protein